MKRLVKQTLRHTLPSMLQPVVVASMGRSGSTLVYNALVEGVARARFGLFASRLAGVVRDVAWDFSSQPFANGRIYKTHGFPDGLTAGDRPRVVFLFGSASDAARSVLHCDITYGRAWIEEHFVHLTATGTIKELPKRDVLRFGEQLDAWLGCEAVPVLALRYEDLWVSGADALLSRFAGYPVSLPARRARASAASDRGVLDAQIAETYAPLDQRIAALPAVQMNARAQALIED